MKKISLIVSFLAASCATFTPSAYAISLPLRPWSNCVDPGSGIATLRCIPTILQNLVTFFLMFAGVLALFFILWAAIKYARSQGDPQEVEGARKTLTYAIIGLVFIMLSFIILIFISEVTGVDQITNPQFPD